MKGKTIFIYILIILLLLLLLVYFFLYNIYGSEVRKSSEFLFADSQSEMIIEVVPVNGLGYKALFRTSSAKFEIIEGNNLIEIISKDESNGILKIVSLGEPGKVGIKIKSQYSLLAEYIEIKIEPRKV